MLNLELNIPSDLLAAAKTMDAAAFGLSLAKLVDAYLALGVIACLKQCVAEWQEYGGDNVPLGLGAQSADADLFLAAVKSRNAGKVKMYIEVGAALESQDEDGDTALIIAVKNKDAVCVKLLIAKGPNLEARDKVSGE